MSDPYDMALARLVFEEAIGRTSLEKLSGTAQLFALLLFLTPGAPLPAITQALGLSPDSASRAVVALSKAGLVSVEMSADDSRVKEIAMTAPLSKALHQMFADMDQRLAGVGLQVVRFAPLVVNGARPAKPRGPAS